MVQRAVYDRVRIQGSGFRIQGLGFTVQGVSLCSSFGFRVLWFRASVFSFLLASSSGVLTHHCRLCPSDLCFRVHTTQCAYFRAFTHGCIYPKGPCTQIVYTLAPMYLYREYFKANVYTIQVHGPLGIGTWSLTSVARCRLDHILFRWFRLEDSAVSWHAQRVLGAGREELQELISWFHYHKYRKNYANIGVF